MKVHYAPAMGTGDAVAICMRVPGWATMTTDRAAITCRWCLRALSAWEALRTTHPLPKSGQRT